MCIIKVYAKSGVDLSTKMGAWAYYLDDFRGVLHGAKMFKNPIKTMTQADCAAYINALFVLAQTAAASEVHTLEIYTDSSKVAKLIEVFEFEKHCEDVSSYWRTTVKPLFTALQWIKIKKLDRKPLSGDRNSENLVRCQVKADGELNRYKELNK